MIIYKTSEVGITEINILNYIKSLKTCPKCGEKKPRTTEYWHKSKNMSDGFDSLCKGCSSISHRNRYLNNKKIFAERSRIYYLNNKERYMEQKRIYHSNNQARYTELEKKYRLNNGNEYYAKKARDSRYCLDDSYVKAKIRRQQLPITPEMIELKRQQIIMKRTLKLFKKWRFENESDSTDVQGKQCEDEKDYVRAVQC